MSESSVAEIEPGTGNPQIGDFDEVGEFSEDDYFQDGRAERGDGEFEYPLTSFVPRVDPPPDGKGIPDGAVRWIVPDITNVKWVRTVKIFKSTFQEKIPPGYNMLFIRVDPHTRRANPTPLQEAIMRTVVARYTTPDGLPTITQTALLPVYRLTEGQWRATVAEMSAAALDAIIEANDLMEDATNGALSLATRPIAVWRPKGGDNRTVNARIDKTMVGSMDDIRSIPGVDLRQYVRVRAVATEKWWAQAWRNHVNGVTGTSADAEAPTETEQFVDACLDLTSAQLRKILEDNLIGLGGARTKQALVALITENKDSGHVFTDVMAIHKMMTEPSEPDPSEVPF